MPGTDLLGTGFPWLAATVTAIGDDNVAEVVDRFGKRRRIPIHVRRGKGPLPRVGEHWIIDNSLGFPTFAAMIEGDLPVLSGMKSPNAAQQSILQYLHDSGLAVDETTAHIAPNVQPLLPGNLNAPGGNSEEPAAASHIHSLPPWGLTANVSTLAYGGTPSAGASGKFADAAHSHGMPAATSIGGAVPASRPHDVGAAGASGVGADRDHIHLRDQGEAVLLANNSGQGPASQSIPRGSSWVDLTGAVTASFTKRLASTSLLVRWGFTGFVSDGADTSADGAGNAILRQKFYGRLDSRISITGAGGAFGFALVMAWNCGVFHLPFVGEVVLGGVSAAAHTARIQVNPDNFGATGPVTTSFNWDGNDRYFITVLEI